MKLPYSFSIWTISTFPPLTAIRGRIIGSSVPHHESTKPRNAGSAVRGLSCGPAPEPADGSWSHHGSPPASTSAQTYGPGRSSTQRPSAAAASRNASRSSGPEKSYDPGRNGSCRCHIV